MSDARHVRSEERLAIMEQGLARLHVTIEAHMRALEDLAIRVDEANDLLRQAIASFTSGGPSNGS